MTKALGFSLILAAALLFAAQRYAEGKRRAESLDSFCLMLEHMRGILENQAPPIPELLDTLSRRCDGPARDFSMRLRQSMGSLGRVSFRELWTKALCSCNAETDPETLRERAALGTVLGRYDLETQCASINECLRALRQRQEQLKKTLPQSARLSFGIALCAAFLLGILLF